MNKALRALTEALWSQARDDKKIPDLFHTADKNKEHRITLVDLRLIALVSFVRVE